MPKDKIYDKIHTIVNQSKIDDKLEKLALYCKKKNVKFTDKAFPPEESSLIGNPTESDYDYSMHKNKILKYKFARPENIFENNDYELFKKIEPTDILQGELGDCYFLAALACLAEYPPLIARLFEFDQKNPYGFYPIWLHINGAWKRIIVDDYLPVFNTVSHSYYGQKDQLCFSQTNEKELWVILLEKAYAKAFNGYYSISGGITLRALRDLTGAPYERIPLKNNSNFEDKYSNMIWEKLKIANDKQYMMTCSTPGNNHNIRNKNNLAAGHAYSILDVIEYNDINNRIQRLIQIKNPWGKIEWNGDFSDESDLWRYEDKNQYINKDEDGIFWIKAADFVENFDEIGVLLIQPDYRSNSVNFVQTKESNKSIAKLIIDESFCKNGKIDITISIDQTSSKTMGNSYSLR